jgi:ubiquinone/menaquinone biosynthesis C-methylase UbiE
MRKMIRPPAGDETRTPEELYEHYIVERELAARLRHSTKGERSTLYSEVYNELFRRVPRHPQLTRVASPSAISSIVRTKMRLLSGFLKPDTVFLEVGAGDCRLPMEVAKQVRKVYAVDVSDEVNKGIAPPPNFELIISNGTDIPVPANTVDLAFSYQLMEHVHPDDAVEQLRSLYNVLAPGGHYMCVTPNRLNGPHDISMYFDREATAFHLKEYTVSELSRLFRDIGFDDVFVYTGSRGNYIKLPAGAAIAVESGIRILPWSARRAVAKIPGIAHLLVAAVVGVKAKR